MLVFFNIENGNIFHVLNRPVIVKITRRKSFSLFVKTVQEVIVTTDDKLTLSSYYFMF